MNGPTSGWLSAVVAGGDIDKGMVIGMNIGAEYVFMDMFAFRGGYKFNYDEEGLTAGFGFNYNLAGFDMKLDYSYSDFGIFDAINRFSFGFSF